MPPCTWNNCSDQVEQVPTSHVSCSGCCLLILQTKSEMGYWALHQCNRRHLLGSGWIRLKSISNIHPSLVPGIHWMTGYGWTNLTLWKSLRGLARSTLTTIKTFMMSMKRQISSSDSLAWDQKLVSALIGMMEAGDQNNIWELFFIVCRLQFFGNIFSCKLR